MLNAIGYLVGSRVLDPTRLIGVVGDALLDPQDWSIRQLAVTVGSTRLKHTVGLDPQVIHADRPQDPERVKTLTWHPTPQPPALAAWPTDGRRDGARRATAHQAQAATGSPWATGIPSERFSPSASPTAAAPSPEGAPKAHGSTASDPRSWLPAQTLIGREVHALGHPVGQVQDLVFDDADWRVRYLIVTLHGCGPMRRRVLVDIDWLDHRARLGADAAPDQAVCLTLDAAALRLSPGFEDVGSIDADLAQRLPAPPPSIRKTPALAGG